MKTQWLDLSDNKIDISENAQYVGLFIGREGEKLESSLSFIHNTPEVVSNILIKAILFENSYADILGNLVIGTGARNVDAYLKIDILLMSNKARARAIPGLEITEDDVKGGHGATVGPVDETQLFYLQSKGLNKKSAERILAEGFIKSALEPFGNEIPEELEKQLSKLNYH
ncbi:SufD family Fe-S cluster assembly protein [Candidatus Dojkabacteria bacterium]|uniref:SufD family Fe-S cluster assembly protein n=1 Tax=Candidatus Dojkabacteria bacterium TaxID=2099670 RepID=A0A955L6Z5_9BACT|nr:SufD family Fe-S cluster assembly protein [Candidatus Dojkabacteria bacterium]